MYENLAKGTRIKITSGEFEGRIGKVIRHDEDAGIVKVEIDGGPWLTLSPDQVLRFRYGTTSDDETGSR